MGRGVAWAVQDVAQLRQWLEESFAQEPSHSLSFSLSCFFFFFLFSISNFTHHHNPEPFWLKSRWTSCLLRGWSQGGISSWVKVEPMRLRCFFFECADTR